MYVPGEVRPEGAPWGREGQSDVQNLDTSTIVARAIGVAKLDEPTYEAIEHDEKATEQAAVIVAVVAIAGGIGAIAEGGVLGLIGGVIGGIAGWLLFAAVAYVVGTRLLPAAGTEATWYQLLRCMGYAQIPNVLSIFNILGDFGAIIGFVGSVWALVTAVIGLRVALEVSTGRAIAIGLISAIATGIILFMIFLPFGIASLAFS
jgi:hypothetical protein